MPATVSQVANGLKARLATISGLRTFSYQPEQVNPPVAFPILESVEYHRAFGGGDVQMRFTVMTVVGRYLDRVAHTNLDGYLSYSGATSLRAAIEGDPTLGGVAQTLVLDSGAAVGSLTVAEADFLSVSFSVLVHA
ncbi:MAG: hypothetical protein EB034_02310 [Verrucomicrobia bacterium]|nr:hypothetical protein [Verrucomicrobiota bacterium]